MNLNFFRRAAPDTTNRKIFRAAVIVGVLSLVARFAAMAKELIVARSFGRGDAIDAFLIAFVLPSFVLNIGMSSLGYALVPVFVETQQREGKEAAGQLLSDVLFLGAISLTAIAALLGLLAPLYLPLLGHGFSPEKLALTRELLYLLLPWVIFSGLAALGAAVLNANEKFALPALTPLLTSLLTMLLVLFASRRWSAFVLAMGAVAGSLLEMLFLFYALRKRGLPFHFRRAFYSDRVRAVLLQYRPMLAGAVLMGSTTVVDQAMAAMLPAGSVAALGYANKAVNAIVTLGAVALSTATLPYFSRMAAASDWAGCRHTLKRYSTLVVGVTVPLTLLIVAFSRPIVTVLYQRGAFTPADTELVSWIQLCYAIQIPFYIWGILFVRFISAIRRNEILMYASAINLAVDITLNILLMRIFHVAGIAMSTSIVYIVSFLMLSTWSIRFLARERLHPAAVAQAEATH